MTSQDPTRPALPTPEEAERFFTEVLPARSASPQPVRQPSPRARARATPARSNRRPRIRSRSSRPHRFRRAAAVIPWGWLWSVVVIGGIVTSLLLGTPPGTVHAGDVRDGECTDRRVTRTSEQVLVVDCASAAAQARVDGRFWLPFGPYPGRDTAAAAGRQRCAADSAGSASPGVLAPVVPTADDWQEGNRLVLCTHLVR